jgi:uncharacterized protein YbjT (DUF2867 family)
MRILVLGATGYVGSRLVPALVDAGHEVVAASSSAPAPERFSWGRDVEWARCDVTDRTQVDAALDGVDAVAYLVHSLSVRGFAGRDLLGAQVVRRAVDAAGVSRLVYLSGLVPDVPRGELSPHIASRLEVEDELLRASCSTVALRAGVVIGAGSTSYEVIRQLSTLLLVQPVPRWLRSRVQPIAVTDCVRALVECFDQASSLEGPVDIGGPDVLRYPRLLAACARASRLWRLRVPAPSAPTPVVSLATAGLVQAPFWTVAALVESLHHDMVCRPDATWVPADGRPLLGVREAMERAVGRGAETDLERGLASDPDWTRTDALGSLPVPAHWRAGASLARHRLRALIG